MIDYAHGLIDLRENNISTTIPFAGEWIMSVLDMRHKSGEIRTQSAVRAWWLLNIKNYRLKMKVKSNPEPTVFGRIRYKKTWVLEPPVGDTNLQTRQLERK